MRRSPLQLVVLAALLGAACSTRDPLPPDAPDVLLVSIDTLRFDAVRGSGRMRARTPVLDALFEKGVAFDDAHAHVPMTLPSHANAFTGELPPALALHDNAPFPLRRDVPTLATLFAAAGYATAAVVGGEPLAEGCGLERGFARYDSPQRARSGAATFGQRDAAAVTDAVAKLLQDPSGGRRRFLFAHYFDCHQPYDPPRDFLTGDPDDPIDRYRGEVARVDHELGRLLDVLRAGKRRWLLVLFADHGEGLGDHGELTHGYQVFEATMHVPLLFAEIEGAATRPPASLDRVAARTRLAGLCDLFPTVLRCVGLPVPGGIAGRPLQEPAARATCYVESLAASLQFGWAQVTGVRAPDATLVHAGGDVPADLGGLTATATGPLDERVLLAPGTRLPTDEELAQWRADWIAARVATIPAAEAQGPGHGIDLKAFGYLEGSRDPSRHALRPIEENARLPSPLARAADLRELLAGVAALDRKDATSAALAFDRILARDPDLRAALLHRARARLELENGSGTATGAAVADLERLTRLEPAYPGARLLLAKALGLAGRFTDAFAVAGQAAESEPAADVERLLGSLHLQRTDRAGRQNPAFDRERGVNELIHSLELDPTQDELAGRVDALLEQVAREAPPPPWLAAAQERSRRRRGRRYPPGRPAYSDADRRFRASGGVVTRRWRRRPARRNRFVGELRATSPS